MNRLVDAISLATTAHAGQVYGHGAHQEPYIKHPLRVMFRVQHEAERTARLKDPIFTGMSKEDLMIVAVLHDVLEDTTVREEELTDKFGRHIAGTIWLLSRTRNDTYKGYIRTISRHPAASLVKLQDLYENLDNSLYLPQDKRGIVNRYNDAVKYLISTISVDKYL